MNIAIILAGGEGTRVKGLSIPKQFVLINDKPVVFHTVDHFIYNSNIDHIVIVCHPQWIDYTKAYLNYNSNLKRKCHIISGGKFRNESIQNAIIYLDEKFNITNDDIILTHDGVRMFVSEQIINNNIDDCAIFDAVTTAIPVIDTIAFTNNNLIENTLDRSLLYNIQTPQTFRALILKEYFLHKQVIDTTDLCQLIEKDKNYRIKLVKGSYENFKITTYNDLEMAKILVNNKQKEG